MATHDDHKEHLFKEAEFLDSDDEAEQEDVRKHWGEKSAVRPIYDPRFEQPTPARWKRVALLIFIGVLFWIALNMRSSLLKGKKQKVIYASRYSNEHKFRPAASPIITETLSNGQIRIRGAGPTETPTPIATAVKKRIPMTGKPGGKRSSKRRGTKKRSTSKRH